MVSRDKGIAPAKPRLRFCPGVHSMEKSLALVMTMLLVEDDLEFFSTR
jgi:hypothetical protein